MLKKKCKDMIIWSSIGVCNEVIFTAITEYYDNDNIKLTGYSYIWLIPIYSLLPLLFTIIDTINKNIFIKVLLISLIIMCCEFSYGLLLQKIAICPWEENYKLSYYTIYNVVRLDYFPFWYVISFIWYQIWKL